MQVNAELLTSNHLTIEFDESHGYSHRYAMTISDHDEGTFELRVLIRDQDEKRIAESLRSFLRKIDETPGIT